MPNLLDEVLDQIIREAEFSRDMYLEDAREFNTPGDASLGMAWDQAIMAIQGIKFGLQKDVTL